jgi:hypothetical protein
MTDSTAEKLVDGEVHSGICMPLVGDQTAAAPNYQLLLADELGNNTPVRPGRSDWSIVKGKSNVL